MVRVLSRSSVALCVAVLVLLVPMGNSAGAADQPTGSSHRGPDVSTDAGVQSLSQNNQVALAQFTQDLDAARPYVTIDQAGFFHVAPGYHARPGGFDARAQLGSIDSQLQAYKDRQTRAEVLRAAGLPVSAQAWWCWYIPNWALDAYAWIIIIDGGIFATASLFVDATVIGIPLGLVLGVLGIWVGVTGGFLLWYFDKYYPNGVWICR